jgi:competence protein ComEC
MNQNLKIAPSVVIFILCLCLLITGFSVIGLLKGHNSIAVFCDVGQGDGAYIRVDNAVDILVDAGPDDRILQCLGKYMPFYDRTIEIAFLSHPQRDHYGGFESVLHHYTIEKFVATPLPSSSKLYNSLLAMLAQKGTQVLPLYQGDQVDAASGHLTFYWPSADFVATTKGTLDPNEYSQIFLFDHGNFSILFTGDTQPDIEDRLLQQAVGKVTLLKVPHHGSTNGLTAQFYLLADPMASVISVGLNNSYGHPSGSTLEMIEKFGGKIRRTDKEGDIVYRF